MSYSKVAVRNRQTPSYHTYPSFYLCQVFTKYNIFFMSPYDRLKDIILSSFAIPKI